jgi:hypothetical protein
MLPLDSREWSALQHAYGLASDIPPLLRSVAADIASSDAADGTAWFDLWSALCHQGDVYPASFAAIPHVIEALASHPGRASYQFFLLPAAVEVARHRRNTPVPKHLEAAYFAALRRLSLVSAQALSRQWDNTLCRSVLAALAAAKGHLGTAELLLEVDQEDVGEVLQWYFAR